MTTFRKWGSPLTLHYLPPRVVVALEAVLVAGALTRGIDYLAGVTADTAILAVTQALLSTREWGWLFLVGGLALGLGLATWRHVLLWAGHVYLAGLNVWFLIAAAQVTLPFHEFRVVCGLLLPTAVHFMLAWHFGAVPVKRAANGA